MKKKVKFCGIRRESEIELLNRLKPEFVGFVFAESRRKVSEKEAAALSEKLNREIHRVGVFVDECPEKIERLWKNGVIQAAQLHGREDEDYIRRLRRSFGGIIIKAVQAESPEDILKAQEFSADYLLFDHGRGGTGKSFSWEILEEAGRQKKLKPFFLAGGIGLENIRKAMETKAWCLDISSGIETDGIKDGEKMRKIIETVREV